MITSSSYYGRLHFSERLEGATHCNIALVE